MVVRKIIQIDEDKCNGCGQCALKCAEGALKIVDGKAKVISDKFCDGLGACIGECPEDALHIVERDVDEFDEKAVEEHLHEMEHHAHGHEHHGHSCPSAKPMILEKSHHGHQCEERESMLGHWPIQLMLVGENAPFLRGKDLILLADCAAVAYANLHEKFLDGKAVVMGCPKFDDAQVYVKKLTGIMKNSGIKSATVVHMEVPCCFGLQTIADEATKASGGNVPLHEIVVGIKGEILESR